MSIEKVNIIASTLERQIEAYKKQSKLYEKEMSEHDGACQALSQLAKQMPALADNLEKRIDEDMDLGPSTKDAVRTYVKNIVSRFTAMCVGNAEAQRNQKFVSSGRAESTIDIVKNMEKEIETTRAHEARRQDLAKEELAKEKKEKAAKRKTAAAEKKKKAAAAKKNGKSTKKPAAKPRVATIKKLVEDKKPDADGNHPG